MSQARITTLVALLCMLGQLHIILHAAEYGTDPHHHEGTLCTLVLPEDEYDLVVHSNTFELVPLEETAQSPSEARFLFTSTYHFWPQANAPPLNA